MAGFSVTMAHGKSGFINSDFSTGTNAPSAGDFELRWNTSNTNGKNIFREDVIFFCKAMIRLLQTDGGTVNVFSVQAGGTTPPPMV